MRQRLSRNMLLPGFVGAAVVGIGLSLLAIVARSPYTHANLDLGFDPGYTRTGQMVVGAPVLMSGSGMSGELPGDAVQAGKVLFVTQGCAACHGLDGRGGVVAPSIVDTKADKLRVKTSVGPKGMPAYAPGALTDQDLADIAAYLAAMNK
ncbi:MAG: c-type cytochrome [Anaerolineae bacterium]